MEGQYSNQYEGPHGPNYPPQSAYGYPPPARPHGESDSFYSQEQSYASYSPPGGNQTRPYHQEQAYEQNQWSQSQQRYEGGYSQEQFTQYAQEQRPEFHPMSSQHSNYTMDQYPPQPHPSQGDEEERGFMGAVAGGAAGAYGGHKLGHGILGGLGGAVAGSMAQDAWKDHRKHQQQQQQAQAHPPLGYPPTGVPPQPKYGDQGPPPPYSGAYRGNFHASARNVWLDGGHELVAECADVNGRHHRTGIDLDHYITNDNGEFAWVRPGEPGNFSHSARHIRLENGGSVLEAELCEVDGHWRRDRIVLDERIGNDNGRLHFVS